MTSLNNQNNKVIYSDTPPHSLVGIKVSENLIPRTVHKKADGVIPTLSIGLHKPKSTARAKGRDPFNAESAPS
jgi:hypothetical protein